MKKLIYILPFFLLFAIPRTTIASYDATSEYLHARLQKYPLSCEFSALSAILTRMSDSAITEDMLIAKSPKSWYGVPSRMEGGVRVWGDPEQGFVGNIYGSESQYTGYGIYEKPMKTLVESFGFSGRTLNAHEYGAAGVNEQIHLEMLFRAIEAGNSVLLLADICTDPRYDDGTIPFHTMTNRHLLNGSVGKNTCKYLWANRKTSWKTWRNGKMVSVEALSGDHAFVLLGYLGTRDRPTHVRVFDTYTGFHTYPIGEWLRKWRLMNNRSLIIEKPQQSAPLPPPPPKTTSETGATASGSLEILQPSLSPQVQL